MITLRGKGASRGIAIGRARLLQRQGSIPSPKKSTDVMEELGRYERARAATIEELQQLYERLLGEIGEEQASIFSVQAMMAEDEDIDEAIRREIMEGGNAEHAVTLAKDEFSAAFEGMEDEYMRARAEDVRQVSRRILEHLHGVEANPLVTNEAEGQIVCAEDLSPAETVGLDRRLVSGIVTARGSINSHTAILARTLGIPALVGVGEEWRKIDEGGLLVLDGEQGVLYVAPDERVLGEYQTRLSMEAEEQRELLSFRDKESRTADGRRVEICANVGSMDDVQDALRQGCDGIGLLRSEFIYMGRDELPSEDEQFGIYCDVLQAMKGKRVVVRTLDVGADKQAACIPLEREENPALGLRGIRVSLKHPEIFLTQCRALLRAAVHGRLAVMFPMITSFEEVRQARELWERAKGQLQMSEIPYGESVEIGIMIETPAAALISDRLAPLVDFFSIGSNDLSQYTLAMDRQNEALDAFYDSCHEAVLRLIRRTVENARRQGIWVGICGEIGADPERTADFLNMGIEEFSVVPHAILPLRRRVRNTRVETTEGQTIKKEESGETWI